MNPDFTPTPSINPTPDDNQPRVVISNGQPMMPSPAPAANRKRLMIIVAAVVLAVAAIGTSIILLKHNSKPETTAVAISGKVADVSITAAGYMPQTVTVERGQQVTFTNNDATPRQIAADDTTLPSFSTVEPLEQGDAYTYTFEDKGTFHYYDPSDPSKFVGTVTVK